LETDFQLTGCVTVSINLLLSKNIYVLVLKSGDINRNRAYSVNKVLVILDMYAHTVIIALLIPQHFTNNLPYLTTINSQYIFLLLH